jgi:hypothetical protein
VVPIVPVTYPRMERDARSRFRITVWPQQPLPQPSNPAWRSYALHPPSGLLLGRPDVTPLQLGDLVLSLGAPDRAVRGEEPEGTWPELDGETYLLLADLDLGDSAAVVRFINAYGILGARRIEDGERVYRGFAMEPGSDEVFSALDAHRTHAAEVIGGEAEWFEETIEEFRFSALCLRDLLTAWRVISGDLAHEDAAWVSPAWHVDSAREPLNDDPWEPGGPERLLSGYLTDALRSFSPRVFSEWLDDERPYDAASRPFDSSDPTLYDICCLELFNHIVERAAYRRCQNETCARLFVRQAGRAQHGQRRTTGVMYCSSSCARAQAQRAYRARRRRRPTPVRDA